MLIDKPQIVEGSSIINATIPSGDSFPASPNVGELFYLTAGQIGFYSYGGAGVWAAAANATDLVSHISDGTLHLSVSQNATLDALTVGAAVLNSIPALQAEADSTSASLASHVIDTTLHISAAQNTLLDGLTLPNLTAANVNYLIGTTADVQGQLDTLTTTTATNTSNISSLSQSTTAANQTLTTNLNAHIADDTRHLTASQNTFMDGITVAFGEVNKLSGLAAFLGVSTLSSYLGALDGAKLNVNGTNALTADLNAGAFRLTNVGSPVTANDAATKDYVDSFVQGLHWVGSTRVATTANISLIGLRTIDGITLVSGDRVLVKDQSTSSENGIWIVASTAWVRANDYKTVIEVNNSAVFVLYGTTQGKSTWVETSTIATVGADPITFSAFSGPVVNSAGPGILLGVGGMVSVIEGEGIKFNGNAVAADVFSGGGLITTLDGTTASVDPASQLALTRVGTAGSYRSVTTDATGRVTAGSNPTTLAGYGITDALANNVNGTLTGSLNVTTSVTSPSFIGALTGNATTSTSSTFVTSFANSSSGVKTGRNTWANGLYTYGGSTDPNAPTTYHAAVGFGNGTGGSAELSVNWVNQGTGIWYRGLRDTTDSWYGWTRIVDTNNIGAYAPSLTGVGASGTWPISITGNSGSASTVAWLSITGKPTATSWVSTALEVSKYLGWKNYGDPHVIFDASAGTAPNGSAVSNTNPGSVWTTSYPTLMGWNGSSSYGVRVDTARYAETAATATNSSNTSSVSNATSGSYSWTGVQYFYSNKGSGSYLGNNATYNLEAYSTDTGAAAMSFHRGGAYAVNMGLDPDNVFRIGGLSAAANRLQMDMSGNLTMAGDITAFSDARSKKDVETILEAGAKVAAMRGVNFTRIEDGSRSTGVIAQEVQAVFPEAVMEGADGMLSVKYGNMVGLLVEAVKELQAEVAALKAAK
jgi:hypothetical protein